MICAIAAFTVADTGEVFAAPPIFGDPQFAVGLEPRDVEIADLDGDGITDAVTPNFGDDTVSVMLGTGGGEFVEHAILDVGGGPQAVAIADFNDDGYLDIAVAQRVNQVALFGGDGSGNFTLQANIAVSGTAQDVVAADLAGDPLPDLAVAISEGTEGVTLLVNNGSFGFVDDGVVFDGGDRLGLAAGDLDGDGDIDLAAGTISRVTVFLNSASGLAFSSNLMVGGTALRLALGDLDGDGDLDLAATNFGAPEVAIARNLGSGSFAPVLTESVGTGRVTSVDIADLNGDGNGEILATIDRTGPGLLAILSSDPSTGFTLSTQEVATVPVSLKAAFIDSDARVDTVIVGGSFALDAPLPGKMTVLLNRGFGGLGGYRVYDTAADTEPRAVIAADFDGNGSLDLAVANFPGTSVSILLNNGFGRFSAAAPVTNGIDRPYSMAADDLDGDGDTDLVVGNNAGFLTLHRNLGGGSFASAEIIETAGRSPQVAIADMDGDVVKDIVLAHTVPGMVLVLFNDSTGTFPTQSTQAVSASFNLSLVLADVDGMNGPDAVVAGRDGDLSVLLNDGSGALGPATVYPIGAGSDLVALASDDIDGDGDPDFAVADHGNEVVHLYQNVGGTLMFLNMFSAGEELVSVLLADLNNDGNADLVTSNQVAATLPGESVSVRLGSGSGTFGDPQEYLAGRGASGMAAANLTPGPSKDLAVTDTERSTVWVLTVGAGGIPVEVDTDLDGIGDLLEQQVPFLDYLDPDSDNNGLADGLDPGVIAGVVETIDTALFSSPGQKKALLGQLTGLNLRSESFNRGEDIAIGEVFHPTENQLRQAIGKLENIFTRFDGCLGQKDPDKSDWIIDCNEQFQVQNVFQTVLTNYYSIVPLQQQLPPGM